jgi:hypothetical protein
MTSIRTRPTNRQAAFQCCSNSRKEVSFNCTSRFLTYRLQKLPRSSLMNFKTPPASNKIFRAWFDLIGLSFSHPLNTVRHGSNVQDASRPATDGFVKSGQRLRSTTGLLFDLLPNDGAQEHYRCQTAEPTFALISSTCAQSKALSVCRHLYQ